MTTKFHKQLRSRLSNRLKNEYLRGKLQVMPRRQRFLVGCSFTDWAKWLGLTETSVLTAMIHIDHIIPVSQYDLNDIEDLYRCFNYRNTQLLPADVHGSKQSKIPDEATLIALEDIWPMKWVRLIGALRRGEMVVLCRRS